MFVFLLSLSVAGGAEPAEIAAPVRAAWERHFGPMPDDALAVSLAGRVSLPVAVRYGSARLAEEWTREGLDTPERREKAVVSEGPALPGFTVPAYAHFLGTDPPGTDTWGDPRFVAALVDLSAGWFAACATRVADPAVCTVQIGDIAWLVPEDPDPLGHVDHDGTCADIRLFRSDGSRYEAWWNRPDDRPGRAGGYDAGLTVDFLAWVADHQPLSRAISNDPRAAARLPLVERHRGHDDHVHLCLDVARL